MKKSSSRKVLLYILISLTLVFILFPVFWIFIMSIRPEAEQFILPPRPFVPTLQNYVTIFLAGTIAWQSGFGSAVEKASGIVSGQTAGVAMGNTLIIASVSTVSSILLGLPAAYSFSRFKMRGSRDLQFYILSQRMAPPVAIIVPLFTLLRWAGLNNTYLGLAIAHLSFNLPFAIWLIKGFVDEIPKEMDESAQLDGCSTSGIIWRIIFPLLKPGIAAVAILCFLFSWNEFLFVSILSGPQTTTLTVFLASFITNVAIEWGKLATVVVISFLPAVILVLILQRYLVRGLTFGAVRG
jgi:multiple sugar transport system permease protein